mmetsp:Transcript_26823/g.26734  ORF Transcript_26823/g.26734 Transcript_26823/m.26734 type:complete len:113 (-) Transcript_26823:59-397(-)
MWIINLIKWNAGNNRFIFDDSTLAGARIMNQELIPQKDGEDEQEDPFKRVNAYGLMKKREDDKTNIDQEDDQSHEEKDYFNKSLAEVSDRRYQGSKHQSYLDTKKSKKNKKK